MTTIVTSQYRSVRRSCRSSTGHTAARSDRQFGPLRKASLPINASLFGSNDLLKYRSGVDQCPRPTRQNSGTASAAIKSP